MWRVKVLVDSERFLESESFMEIERFVVQNARGARSDNGSLGKTLYTIFLTPLRCKMNTSSAGEQTSDKLMSSPWGDEYHSFY